VRLAFLLDIFQRSMLPLMPYLTDKIRGKYSMNAEHAWHLFM
jgi:hypothetical protein